MTKQQIIDRLDFLDMCLMGNYLTGVIVISTLVALQDEISDLEDQLHFINFRLVAGNMYQ